MSRQLSSDLWCGALGERTATASALCLWQAKAMFDKAAEISTDLPFKLEFHTGFWASSKCLHAHLIFGTLEYYVARSRYFAERSGPSEPDEVWEAHAQGRAEFVDSYTTKNAGYAASLTRLLAATLPASTLAERSNASTLKGTK
jgi:hypothetical protein